MPDPAGVGDAMRLYGSQPPEVISTNTTGMTRPEPVATADLIQMGKFSSDPTCLALAKALEDTAAERDRAHATLREIAESMANFPCREQWIARERLENP